jgi:hypothetical protein
MKQGKRDQCTGDQGERTHGRSAQRSRRFPLSHPQSL